MNSEKIKLYVHIGQPKTGTSAIQGFLDNNRELLAETYGILYPNFNKKNYGTGYMHNHAQFFTELHKKNNSNEYITIFKQIENYCLDNNIKIILLSNEGFKWEWWPNILKQIIDSLGCDYRIILYLRRQDKFIEAAWKQWGHKIPEYNSIKDLVELQEWDWSEALDLWLSYFSIERFCIRPYERESIGDDVIIDFMKIIGITDLSSFEQPPETNLITNPGFSEEIIEILSLCKNFVRGPNDNSLLNFLFETLSYNFKKKPMQSYEFLSPRDKLKIIEKYKDSNLKIAKTFFGNESERLFKEPLPNPDDTWEPFNGLTIEKLVPIVMEILYKQFKDIKLLKQKSKKSDDNNVKNYLIIKNNIIYELSIFIQQIKNVCLTRNGIEFTSSGYDPIIILPEIFISNKIEEIVIELTSEVETTLELFYKTIFIQEYCESNVIRKPLKPGRNKVSLVLPSNDIYGRLRLDPGCHPGNYILHNIRLAI